MLPKVQVLTGGGEACEFLWLIAESEGPVDPTCGADAVIVLVGPGVSRDRLCLAHAAQELAASFCRDTGMETPRGEERFRQLVRSLEAFLAGIIPHAIQRTAR